MQVITQFTGARGYHFALPARPLNLHVLLLSWHRWVGSFYESHRVHERHLLGGGVFAGETETDARAKMLLYLQENELISSAATSGGAESKAN